MGMPQRGRQELPLSHRKPMNGIESAVHTSPTISVWSLAEVAVGFSLHSCVLLFWVSESATASKVWPNGPEYGGLSFRVS